MRRKMQKEVTFTTVKIAKMEVVDGQPKAVPMADEILLGNVSLEKAQREMGKKFTEKVTVFAVEPDTKKYEMDVDKFIQIATLVQDTPESEVVAEQAE